MFGNKELKIKVGILEEKVLGLEMLVETMTKSWTKLWKEHPELFKKD